ncbi:MAG: hypothetical protein J6W18_02125 [Bacteroidaceae bacterium]|nr:hypothetical protein [Bacteroidaceae bacterium]
MRIDILHSKSVKDITDYLVLFLTVWTVLCFFHNNYNNGRTVTWGVQYNDYVSKSILTALVYCVGRLCFSIHFKGSKTLIYVILCTTSLKEISFCLVQYMHGNKILTGSIGNTGLLGGLISVCMCVLGAVIVKEKRYTRLLFLIPLFVLLVITFSRAAWLSCTIVFFILSLKIEPLHRLMYRWKVPFFLFVLGMGIIVYSLKKESADSRLFMTLLILRNCNKLGLFGVGPGNYCGFYGRSLYDFYLNKECALIDSPIDCIEALTRDLIKTGLPDCAYNELLRTLVETGIIGATFFLTVTLLSFYRLHKSKDSLSYGFLALIIFSQFSFPSKIPLFCCLYALLLAAGSSIPEMKESNVIKPHLVVCSLLTIVALSFITATRRTDSVYKGLNDMKDLYDRCFYDEASKAGNILYDREYNSPKFLLDYGIVLGKIQDFNKSDKVLTQGLEMSASPGFWKALGDNSVNKGDYLSAENQYQHSFIMLPNRMQPLLDLARLYYITGDTIKLSRIHECALRMIPKVENDRTRLMRNEISALQGVK